jgi:hypothetical protein
MTSTPSDQKFVRLATQRSRRKRRAQPDDFTDRPEQVLDRANDIARQAVLVLGMHRSGTSVLTQALSFLGAGLPAEMLRPAADNEAGFFEPREIVDIHDRVLASAGSAWHDWARFPSNWHGSLEAEKFVADLAAAFGRNYRDAPLVVLKDPRVCRFLPLWTRVLSEIKADPIVVLAFRHPVEVAKSLRRRDGFSVGHVYLLWLRHVLDAEFSSRGLSRAFLYYEDFIEDCRDEINRLTAQIPIVWPRESPRAYHQIDTSVKAELRHNFASSDDLLARPDVYGWLRDTFDAHQILRNNPHDEEAMRALDRVRLEFDTACGAFAPAFQGLQVQAEEQAAELAAHRRELAAARSGVAELETIAAAVPALREERDALEAELSKEKGRSGALDAMISRVAILEGELARERLDKADLAQSRAVALDKMSSRVAELEIELSKERHETEDRKIVAARLEQERDALRGALDFEQHRSVAFDEMRLRVADLEQELKTATASLEQERLGAREADEKALARISSLEEMLARSHAELQESREALELHSAEVARLSERGKTLRRVLAETGREKRRETKLRRLLRYVFWFCTFQLPSRIRIQHDIDRRMQITLKSGLFDPDWYLATYPDVLVSGIDPLRHFCERGFLEKRVPGPGTSAVSSEALARQLEAASRQPRP